MKTLWIFEALVDEIQQKSPFYTAMKAAQHVVRKQTGRYVYQFFLQLPANPQEREIMLQSLCDFLQVEQFMLKETKIIC
ncbi:hypothetical protein [Listeria monocytogenes]|uniref:hypothetical protein n=1 Tax=Listeria monocytogenes TaxID=1639 RepID=UPI0011EAC4C6|nr:hypothetical protein [Listeria monocytogenes]TYV31019.1 hypothetical protein FZ060_15375 [Listeria monocytogenes]